MKLRIHHPRLLAALLLIIAGVAAAAVILAGGFEETHQQERFLNYPPLAPQPPLTRGEQQDVVNIAKVSGTVERINGGQTWTASSIFRTKIDGTEAIAFLATWEKPVESSGPWPVVRCQGSRKVVTTHQVRNITRLTVFVDMESRNVTAYSVFGPRRDEPDVPKPTVIPLDNDVSIKAYDFATGEIVHDGPFGKLPKNLCPPGREDD